MLTRKPSSSPSLGLRATFDATPEEQTDFYNGFLEGSHLKKFVPAVSDCSANVTSIINAFRQVAYDFGKRKITFQDVADGILNLGIAIQGVANATKSCQKLPDNFRVIINYFQNITSNTNDYINKVYMNAINNSMLIMVDLMAIQKFPQDIKYYDCGAKIGEIVRLLFNVDATNMMFFLKDGDGDDKPKNFTFNPDQALVCGQKALDVAARAWPVITDIMAHPKKILSDLSTLVGFVKEIKDSCNGVFDLDKIRESVVRVYSRMFRTNLLVVGKNPSIGDVITCVTTMKPVAIDIYEALIAFTKKDQDTAVAKISQLAVHGPPLYESCNKVILTLIQK
jgi:hypothetical protein